MTSASLTLADFGWRPFFASQLASTSTLAADIPAAAEIPTIAPRDSANQSVPVRILAVHRDRLHVAGPDIDRLISGYAPADDREESLPAAGDWVLLDPTAPRIVRILTRQSLFKRRAPGTGRRIQTIAANVDTLFVVSSCNQDFNVARLERYLALASHAGVLPVVVLTKVDLTDAPARYRAAVERLQPGLAVELVNSHAAEDVARLVGYCRHGETVAVLGSSGVGKSTLINTLLGEARLATSGIREDDDKGKHTTTGRALHRLPGGAWLLDTPGMRELQLTDIGSALNEVFPEIAELVHNCRFGDCAHETEPGCAIRVAVEAGTLDPDRVRRWRKLTDEDHRNSASLAERRSRERAFGRLVRQSLRDKRGRREDR